jgi:GntR family transcriptional regulator
MVDGDVGPGDRLPPAKELARSLDVNMHTVLKAYGRLRDDGLVEMRRGRGVTVVDQPMERASLVEAARSLVEQAANAGYLPAEILELVEVQL